MEEILKVQAETLIEILKTLNCIEKKLNELYETTEMIDSRLYTIENKKNRMPKLGDTRILPDGTKQIYVKAGENINIR